LLGGIRLRNMRTCSEQRGTEALQEDRRDAQDCQRAEGN
jgi:hypothetical protein